MRTMFEETIGRILTDLVTPEVIAAAEAGTWPAALWQAIEDNGLGVAAAPENRAGVGGGWHDAFELVRMTGLHVAPVPLAETILANWLLGRAGLDAVTGPATIGVAHASSSLEGMWFIGSLLDVPWGRDSDHVVTVASGSLILLRTADARHSPGLNMAREPRDDLHFDGAKAVASCPLDGRLPDDAVLLGGAMIRSAQTAGALQSLVTVAVEQANQRVQFGQPIGKFQAVQHQIAVLAEHAGLVFAASEAAFAVADDAPSFLAIATAKSVASEAAGLGASVSHAVLGAMGFTYEHPLHFTTRRLWSWRSEFGSQTYWAQRLGTSIGAGGAAALWPSLTAQTIAG